MGTPVFLQPGQPRHHRVRVDGKGFRLGDMKFHPKGVTYGPFGPITKNQGFHSAAQTEADFVLIRELGATVIRVYHPPPRWILDLAMEHGLKLLVDIPWNKHLCVLDSPVEKQLARDLVRQAVGNCGGHPAVFAFSVGNEMPPDIVRWSGASQIEEFIDELVALAKKTDPECLCTYANFPPTEFLRPRSLDFVTFNVYLHERPVFENYLARLQSLAGEKPLVLGEFGMDSIREGEERKCETLSWQIESAFRGGLAGTVVFSFTDDWFKDNRLVEDWGLGLTDARRGLKPSFAAVQKQFAIAPYFPLPRTPRVSVVVASYNGAKTLPACLESLLKLNYPDYEVILVDDGSMDETPVIAAEVKERRARSDAPYPAFKYIRHEKNFGLSVARNTGIMAGYGEIIAFTDADCRADEDWLFHLIGDMLRGDFAGMGGHNLLPPEDSAVATAVMASPGGPAHVMLTDREAEHIPGCNMAFFRSALTQINGFDSMFRRAGDDVDICWRLQQAGFKIGFSPMGFVWHYRRSTVRDYLKQQQGYGEAEALLAQKHPENFNAFGGGTWRGRIYGNASTGIHLARPIIYHGPFGTGFFQTLYAQGTPLPVHFCTSIEFHVMFTLPLWILALDFIYLLPLAVTSLLVSGGVCVVAATQAELPRARRRFWSRPLVALLFFLQPIVRGWARYRGRLHRRPLPAAAKPSLDSEALRDSEAKLDEVCYWSEHPLARVEFLRAVLERLDSEGWPHRTDAGWSNHDVEIYGGRWTKLQMTTAAEDHPNNRRMIRCRLRSRWSLAARATFWLLLGVELLVIGLFSHGRPGLWLLLLLQTAFVWFLRRQARNLQSLVAIWLDGVTKPLGMIKVKAESVEKKPAVKVRLE